MLLFDEPLCKTNLNINFSEFLTFINGQEFIDNLNEEIFFDGMKKLNNKEFPIIFHFIEKKGNKFIYRSTVFCV